MVRCPSCSGRGEVGSTKDALRSAFGKIRSEDVDPETFAVVKKAYNALMLRSPKNGTGISPSSKGNDGGIKLEHLGPFQWVATCPKCGFRSKERGKATSANKDIMVHLKIPNHPRRAS